MVKSQINNLYHYLNNSNRKIRIKSCNDVFKCAIDIKYISIELFKELNINQLQGFIAMKSITEFNRLKN